jgi:proteasome accessory factor B
VGALLDTERALPAEEIGTRVPGYPEPGTDAFHRAFERDKATLREMGVPIEVVVIEPENPESAQGYRIRPDRYELPDPGLTPEELAALHLATTQVRLEGGDATEAIWKLGGVPAGPVPERATTAAIPGSAHLPGLFAATAERRRVTFPYKGEERHVEPWRVEFRNGSWYLVGRDTDRESRRTFRLDRIDGRIATGPSAAFERPAATDPAPTHPWEMGDEEPVDVDVLIDAGQAAWATTTTGGAAPVVERRDDGSVIVRLRVTNRAALRSWVLGFLDHAEILAPPEERDALVSWLEPLAGER